MIRTINCIFSLKDKIRELAESISSEETEELHYLPPLKLLNLVGQNLNREKSPAVMINKTSQSEEKADLNLVNFSLSVPKMSLLNMLGDSGGGEEIEEISRGTTDSRVNTLVVSLELTCFRVKTT